MSSDTQTTLIDTQRNFDLTPSEQTADFNLLKSFFPSRTPLINLRAAIKKYETTHENLNFYQDILPSICQWASDHENSAKLITPLAAGIQGKLEYTARQIRYILANAFFLNTKKIEDTSDNSGYGSLDLSILYNEPSYSNVDIERILCFLDYFHQQQTETDVDQRLITIERYLLEKIPVPDWLSSTEQLQADRIHIMTDRMEASIDAQGFVDFANKHIQIHRMIPSCTQEEILFSCCPEAFLSMLTCESLKDNEIVIVRGCKRFVDYTGYLHTFRYTGRYTYPTNPIFIQDILVMDAVYSGHFKRENVIRDMNKAYLTFKTACLSSSSEYKIVTGHWGCGAFFGDKTHKFLQQICVITLLPNIKLDYSVYMEENLAIKFRDLLKKLNGKSIKDIFIDENMIR